ncbi:MAG: ABC transporter permease [Alphaproteobacteria bacterium]|nr:ABC transporter permease [Alphaproteobacteria bacterium]
MGRLIVRRLFYLVVTMLLASVALFLLFELSPEAVVVNELGPYSTQEQRQIWLEQNGFNRPPHERYLAWLSRFAVGDLGHSRLFNVPVAQILATRLGNTAILAAFFFAALIPLSLSLGALAGMKEGSWLDRVISFICVLTASVPPFASTVLLSAILVFSLALLPGTSSMMDGFSYRELIMPVAVLVLYDFGYVARMTRASMAEVMMTPYVRTALLKGLPYRRVILSHALRNALIAPFTVIMLHVNWLVSGVIVVEFFFAFKGFGSLVLEASLAKDLHLLEACTMTTVVIAVCTQLAADIGYMFLNPRIRFK